MAITKVNHIAINSSSIEKSKRFYCGLLGLEDKCSVDMGECILHYVALADGSCIELFDIKDKAFYYGLPKKEGSIKHIALQTDDVDSMNKLLIENNVKMVMDMCVLESLNVKALLCEDPDGVIIEITQPLD